MITEQQKKAYKAWWYDNMGPLERDRQGIIDGFYAGWRACAAATANSRTAERQAAEKVARQIEREYLKRKFRDLASSSFLIGHDEEAKMYRHVANSLID